MNDPLHVEQDIMTEDDVIVRVGDRVYNYYDMKPGKIHRVNTQLLPDEHINIKNDVWFYFRPDQGQDTILNGARICSMEFAKRRGFKGA